MITILGPTAGGKTQVAACLAYSLNAEVISADSRQVYRRMNLGTGKDYDDYVVKGLRMPVHLVDIAEPGEEYNVFRYVHDFQMVYKEILSRGKSVILCGGSGMYLEAVLRGYQLSEVPENAELRARLDKMSMEDLVKLLSDFGPLHATTDISDRLRLTRAIEIRAYDKACNEKPKSPGGKLGEPQHGLIFGLAHEREIQRQRITARLKQRLENGMLDEVKMLIDEGVDNKQLISYGLEYKFLTLFLTGQLSYDAMFEGLNTAIHQFAKRQMTWFRRMERNNFKIIWIDANLDLEEKLNKILERLNKNV